MLTLHHLENSISIRIIWLLEELGVDYELKSYARDASGFAPAAYKALHPAGTAPIITDGEITLAETNAVVDYLLDQFPDSLLRPAPNSAMRVRYLYWFHASQGSLAPMQFLKFILSMMVKKSPFFLRPLLGQVTGKVNAMLTTPRLEGLLSAMDEDLSQTQWFAGEQFSAVDVVIGQNLEMMAARQDLSKYTHIDRFLTQIRQRDAYKKAVEIAGDMGLSALVK